MTALCLKDLVTTLVNRILVVHYHEWPVYDDKGNPMGKEFTTTRGYGVTFVAETLQAKKSETEKVIVEIDNMDDRRRNGD